MRLFPAAVLLLASLSAVAQAPARIPVKVVVVTMFEIGNDTGDVPGEFQHWVDGEHLTRRFALPHAYWLIAGIGGIDPKMGSLGSGVWSDWIVDGDIAHEIDAREAP